MNTAEDNTASYFKTLTGNPLFNDLYDTYTVTLIEIKAVLKVSTLASQTKSLTTGGEQLTQKEGFKEVRRRKRHNTDVAARTSKKAAVQDKISDALNTLAKGVVTRNYFALLRTADMDTDTSGTESMPHEGAAPGKTGRPPPIVLTSATNLIHLQKQLKGVLKDNSEFPSTRNGTRINTKTMADFSAFKSHLENNNLAYFTFYPKSLKPIKAVICHLPLNTPAEDISDGLARLGFDVISVKQMTPFTSRANNNHKPPTVPHNLA
jgi:hypothetical protein